MSPTTSSVIGGGAGGSGSMSTVVADTATGWHALKISCYSVTKGHGVGKFIKSSTFNVGGHSWHITYYPDGYNDTSVDWISVFLCLSKASQKEQLVVRARLKFCLLDQEGEPDSAYTISWGAIRDFEPAGSSKGWGNIRFIKKDAKWEGSKHVKDDCFSIRCDVAVIMGLSTESTRQVIVAVPPSDLQDDLGRLLSNGEGADVTFDVGGELLMARSNVLAARSSVFKAEFFGPMKEQTSAAPVLIRDMEASVFKALLHFVYTDSLPAMENGEETAMAQHLLVAADRYDLKRLKLICEDKLCNRIEKDKVATTLVLAEQHGCQGLKEACFSFLTSPGNFKSVMTTDGYDHLRKSCPSLLEELVVKLAP